MTEMVRYCELIRYEEHSHEPTWDHPFLEQWIRSMPLDVFARLHSQTKSCLADVRGTIRVVFFEPADDRLGQYHRTQVVPLDGDASVVDGLSSVIALDIYDVSDVLGFWPTDDAHITRMWDQMTADGFVSFRFDHQRMVLVQFTDPAEAAVARLKYPELEPLADWIESGAPAPDDGDDGEDVYSVADCIREAVHMGLVSREEADRWFESLHS